MSTNSSATLSSVFIEEIKRRIFGECFPRLEKCLNELTAEQIWYRPNASSNSVGNLVLHLQGNIRQWVVAGLGKKEDVRERQKEFDEQGPVSSDKMLKDMKGLLQEVAQILNSTSTDDLLEVRNVQGYEESGLSILVHVTEHFSYHVGQMTYIVKMLKDKDMAYYAGHDLDAI